MSGFQAIRIELSPLQVHSKGKRVHVTGDKVSFLAKRFTSYNGFGDEPPVHRNRWHMFIFKLHSESLSPFHWRDSFKGVTSRQAGFNVDSESSGCRQREKKNATGQKKRKRGKIRNLLSGQKKTQTGQKKQDIRDKNKKLNSGQKNDIRVCGVMCVLLCGLCVWCVVCCVLCVCCVVCVVLCCVLCCVVLCCVVLCCVVLCCVVLCCVVLCCVVLCCVVLCCVVVLLLLLLLLLCVFGLYEPPFRRTCLLRRTTLRRTALRGPPQISLFFSLSHPHFRSFSLSLGSSRVNFCGV